MLEAAWKATNDPPGAEFIDRTEGDDEPERIWLPDASVALVLDLVDVDGAEADAPAGPYQRVADLLTRVDDEHDAEEYLAFGLRPPRAVAVLSSWCQRAGAKHVYRPAGSIHRWHPLARAVRADQLIRVLSVEAHTQESTDGDADRGKSFDARLSEDFFHPDEGLHHSYDLKIGPDGLAAFVRMLAQRSGSDHAPDADPEHELTAQLATLVERGELGLGLVPGGSRDRVSDWCRTAGIPYELRGLSYGHDLLEVAQPARRRSFVLWLWFETGSRDPDVKFEEGYRAPGDFWPRTRYAVSTPRESIHPLVDMLAARMGLTLPASLGAEDRMIACFAELVRRGDLGSALPARRNRDRVAAWLAEAGEPYKVTGTERDEELLRIYRDGVGCDFSLTLFMDPDPEGNGITFSEFYDYRRTSADSGREYGYRVRTPYAGIATLVTFFERRLGLTGDRPDDPEDRLTDCFTELVVNGELADDLGLQENRDRVAAWFAEAGVDHESSTWSWINSD